MSAVLRSNDWAFEHESRIVFNNFNPNSETGFVGIDLYNGQNDPLLPDGQRVIINVDREAFIAQVEAFLEEIKRG